MTKNNKYGRKIFIIFAIAILFAVVAFITYDSELSNSIWISFIAMILTMISLVYTLFATMYYFLNKPAKNNIMKMSPVQYFQ